jgi:shikimate dehydrogenase
VIGDPIAQSKSPIIHQFWLAKLGLQGDYRRAHIKRPELAAYLEGRRIDPNWRGCNVTIPHKQAIIPLLDVVEDMGIGAVNCVLVQDGRLIGRNTDAAGLSESLGKRANGANVAMIGAGGAGRAGMAALHACGASNVRLIVRDPQAGQALLAGFPIQGVVFSIDDAEAALSGCAGVLNATPLGMIGYPAMPESILRSLEKLPRAGFVLDMVYAPLRTTLLQRAEAAGLDTIDGLSMLIGQAAHAFRYFYGADAPREHDAELRDLLTR